uniref:G-protein coupled receptors family 1 profile domain-containing protein n=1 Tax=Acrobeloides nanus TaxID=290746 RepID=A0A914DAU4_9BILA
MYLFIGLSISAFAFVGMIINYIMINVMIRNPDMPSRGEDRQILIRTLVLITADMLCWVPTLFFGLTAVGGYPLISLTNAKICLVLFYPINSCANPWLYVFLTRISRDLKKKAVPMLKHMSFIGETHNAVKNYFYSIGPGEQDPLHHDQDSQKFLQVTQNTQMTSLCSSPRSSSSSQCTTKHSDSTHDLLNSAKE